MPLPHLQFLFPYLCPRWSGKFVTCVIHSAMSIGTFLGLWFPLNQYCVLSGPSQLYLL